jgi:hypothetical protein
MRPLDVFVRRIARRADITGEISMKKVTKILGAGAVLAVAGTLGWHALAQTPLHRGFPGMGPGGMGPGAMMGAAHDPTTMGEMSAIHALIVNHDRITRTVTNLPNGIRTVTESDDPQIAQLIKEHVASMVARVDARSDPNLPIESPALHAILENGDKVETKVETTERGAIVVQTSSDPQTVTALQKHAGEVTDLVEGGMSAVHTAMMRNGGFMTHEGIMQHPPFDRMAPRFQ